jgi:hypothetical protein
MFSWPDTSRQIPTHPRDAVHVLHIQPVVDVVAVLHRVVVDGIGPAAVLQGKEIK